MRTHPTDPELLAAYGELLDRLGDRVEAGKYLFLSGRRGDPYDETIELFLARHAKASLGNVTGQFPRALRGKGLAELPAVVRVDLEALGLPEGPGRKPRDVDVAFPWYQQWVDRATCGIAYGCFVLVVLSIPVGLVTMAYLLWRIFR